MPGLLKDDLTVALDDVERVATRALTVYDDLAKLSADGEVAAALGQRREALRAALDALDRARRAHAEGRPVVEEPERAHLRALWWKIRAALGDGPERETFREALAETDAELSRAVDVALPHGPAPAVSAALARVRDAGTPETAPS